MPALAEMLRSGTPSERVAAANTLWGMGQRGSAAVPDLTSTLGDPDTELRVAAAMALQNMGEAAAPAGPPAREGQRRTARCGCVRRP